MSEKKTETKKNIIEKPLKIQETQIVENENKIDTIKIRKYAKLILENKINPSDNVETFQCLKQLYTTNKNDLEFYFKVFRVIVKKSDGALSEIMATEIMDFMKFNPAFFIENYLKFDTNEKNRFIGFMAYEFYLMDPNSKKEMNEYFLSINSKIKSNKDLKYDLEIIRKLTEREMKKYINE